MKLPLLEVLVLLFALSVGIVIGINFMSIFIPKLHMENPIIQDSHETWLTI